MVSIPSTLGFGDRLPSLSGLPSLNNLPSLPSFGISSGTNSALSANTPPTTQAGLDGCGEDMKPVLMSEMGGLPVVVSSQESELLGSPPQDPHTPSPQQVHPPEMQMVPQMVANSNSNVVVQQQPQVDFSIATWLSNLGMSAYVDSFHQRGFSDMFQLQEFSLEDLQEMKIGTQHRNKIWRSLVEFRNSAAYYSPPAGALHSAPTSSPPGSQDLQRSTSSASTLSMASQVNNSGYCPGFYEVTRYTFKHTVSLNNEQQDNKDHNYC